MTTFDVQEPAAPRSGLPLEGVRVLDLTRALAGPFCTTLLGDLGAEIFKVEPPSGDMIRGWGPHDRGESLYHVAVNRNKRSIALDLRSDDGRATLRRMAREVDVIVENFRPGVLADMGLDELWLSENAPDTLVTGITGFGTRGPLHRDACFDQIAQGMSGLMSVTGPSEGPGVRVGLPITDVLTGMFSALGVAASLAGRARGGSHRTVGISMLESVLAVLTFHAQSYLSTGTIPERAGNAHPVLAPYGTFPTADCPVNIAAGTQVQFESLCRVLDLAELTSDPRFADGAARFAQRHELAALIEERLATAGSEHWLALLRREAVPAGPLHDMAGVFADPQIQALEMVETVKHPELGDVSVLRGPFRIDDLPSPVRRPAPRLGENGAEALAELGFSAVEIGRLVDADVLACPEFAGDV